MRYPEFIKSPTAFSVTAVSYGITDEEDILRYKKAEEELSKKNIKLFATPDTFKEAIGASADAKTRAIEFMDAYCSPASKAVFAATGGETEILILSHLDYKRLIEAKPKWFSGYSDNTVINYYLVTNLDTAAIYGYGIKAFGDEYKDESVDNTFEILEGKINKVYSRPYYQNGFLTDEMKGKNPFTSKVEWKTLSGKKTTIKGRAIGGCMDIFPIIIGTPYDNTKEYINKYREDGILWFMESCDLNACGVVRSLWQMKEAGWFSHASGFVFGRPLDDREYCGYNFISAVTEILGRDYPMIFDADFGHKPPLLPIINGSIMTAESENGKGSFEFQLI